MVNSQRKGRNFENKIYKLLRDFGECKKSLGSGSSDEPGDIIFKRYVIECKRYKYITDAMLNRWSKKLYQEIRDKGYEDYFPIIVFKSDWQSIEFGICEKDCFKRNGKFKDFLECLRQRCIRCHS